MKLSLFVFASLALPFALTCHAGSLEGGTAAVDITPEQWPHTLVGSFYPKATESAHDPLHVRAVVLSDGEDTIALAVVDNCLIKREVLDEAKDRAAERTGIPTAHMMVSSTHTHSAPTAHGSDTEPLKQAYREQVTEGIAEAIAQAHARLGPVEVGWGGVPVEDEVFNRRWFLKPGTMPVNPFGETTDIVKMNPGSGPHLISPAGPVDPEVSVLSVRDAKGKPLSLFANYSLHYVGAIPGRQVSADYFGEFARLMVTRLRADGERFVGILSNGTSGDVNNINFANRRPPREPFEQIRIVAAKVADAAYVAQRDASHAGEADIAVVERIVTLKVRKPDEDLLARCHAYLEREAAGDEKDIPKLAPIYARRVIALAEHPDTIDMKIQAIRIGELVICTLPFEVFAEIGLELKKRSPFADTFVVSFANGAFGYLPTPEQHVFGGYETWLSTNRVERDASEILTEELVAMMNELHDETGGE